MAKDKTSSSHTSWEDHSLESSHSFPTVEIGGSKKAERGFEYPSTFGTLEKAFFLPFSQCIMAQMSKRSVGPLSMSLAMRISGNYWEATCTHTYIPMFEQPDGILEVQGNEPPELLSVGLRSSVGSIMFIHVYVQMCIYTCVSRRHHMRNFNGSHHRQGAGTSHTSAVGAGLYASSQLK